MLLSSPPTAAVKSLALLPQVRTLTVNQLLKGARTKDLPLEKSRTTKLKSSPFARGICLKVDGCIAWQLVTPNQPLRS
jgi:ribosomal protein S12